MQTAPGVAAAAPAPPSLAGPDDGLTLLHEGAAAVVETVRCMAAPREHGPFGYMPRFHFAAPLSGSYLWRSGGEEFFADPACVLYAPANEAYSVSHPMGGDCSVVITPRVSALELVLRRDRAQLSDHPRLRRGSRAAGPGLQLLLRRIVAIAQQNPAPLQLDEMLVELIWRLVADEALASAPAGPAASRAVRAAKAYLHEHLAANPTLAEVAAAAELSPCHLTHIFRQAEGMPLYRYQLALRLSLALESLPRCEDLTALALELGFSSHSHFSSMFRARFGLSPSALRAEMAAGAPVETPDEPASPRPSRSFRPLCAARGGRAA